MVIDYAFIWAGLIAVAVLMYVLLDGFDLGIGILFPFLKDRDERMLAMSSVAPVWDGNETWLVLGGAGLLAAGAIGWRRNTSGRTPSTRKVAARTIPAEVMTPPVTVRPRGSSGATPRASVAKWSDEAKHE